MNIHEIIQAWEDNSLPTDIEVLAAMQNKIDDYAQKAIQGSEKAQTRVVFEMYDAEARCYQELSAVIERHTANCIPDLKPKKAQLQS